MHQRSPVARQNPFVGAGTRLGDWMSVISQMLHTRIVNKKLIIDVIENELYMLVCGLLTVKSHLSFFADLSTDRGSACSL